MPLCWIHPSRSARYAGENILPHVVSMLRSVLGVLDLGNSKSPYNEMLQRLLIPSRGPKERIGGMFMMYAKRVNIRSVGRVSLMDLIPVASSIRDVIQGYVTMVPMYVTDVESRGIS